MLLGLFFCEFHFASMHGNHMGNELIYCITNRSAAGMN
jgi:hypothetical protein